MGHHLAAVPMKTLKVDHRIVLLGATREELKKMPAFKYSPSKLEQITAMTA